MLQIVIMLRINVFVHVLKEMQILPYLPHSDYESFPVSFPLLAMHPTFVLFGIENSVSLPMFYQIGKNIIHEAGDERNSFLLLITAIHHIPKRGLYWKER